MPAKWLTSLSGERIAFADVDMARTEEQFGLPPAEIAALINDQAERADVTPGMVTASQAENGARQLFLEENFDFSIRPAKKLKALLGTMRHAVVNVEHDDLVVEKRFFSECGRFSAKVDSFVPAIGEVRDYKSCGYFKTFKILKEGVEREGWGYMMQLNLAAWIIRDHGFEVKSLKLDFRPPDCGKAEKRELADKFGITYTGEQCITVDVPMLGRADAFAPFEALWKTMNDAREHGVVPGFCTRAQTWNGRKCLDYCDAAEVCQRVAAEQGDEHPFLKAKEESAA